MYVAGDCVSDVRTSLFLAILQHHQTEGVLYKTYHKLLMAHTVKCTPHIVHVRYN